LPSSDTLLGLHIGSEEEELLLTSSDTQYQQSFRELAEYRNAVLNRAITSFDSIRLHYDQRLQSHQLRHVGVLLQRYEEFAHIARLPGRERYLRPARQAPRAAHDAFAGKDAKSPTRGLFVALFYVVSSNQGRGYERSTRTNESSFGRSCSF